MSDPLRSTYRRNLRAALGVLAVGVGLAGIYSCSLIVDSQSQQCKQDSDCATLFGSGVTCNTATGLCVSPSTSSGSSSSGGGGPSSTSSSSGGASPCDVDGGIDGGGCYDDSLPACPVSTTNANSQLINACTTGCIPFDDSLVKGLVDGGLPGLPNPPDGGL